VGHGDEGIVLSEREREALAGLAESIGDPWLAGQLAGRGQGHAPPQPKAPRRPTWAPLAASGWTGPVLLVVGALLAMTTFMHSAVAATLGLALMGVGLWRLVADHGDRLSRRLSASRSLEGRPLPPRTPPTAA